MARTMRATCAAALAVTLMVVAARAENMDITTAGITLGERVSGPEVDVARLQGSVVVLEFWGVHCPPCIASMPGLEALHKQLAPQGLVVIGAHAQGGPVDEVRKTVTELGVTFPVVEHARVQDGMDFDGIPHCMVFDHTGKCVYRGSPSRAHDVIVAAVQAAPAGVLAGRELVKLAGLGEKLKQESAWSSALKTVRSMVNSKDEATAEEARFVVERMEARGRDMLSKARDLAAEDPVAAATLVQQCSGLFKGDDVGKEAVALAAEWKKDKAFQAALRAGQQLARLEALKVDAERVPGGVPTVAVGKAREMARMIETIAPGTAYADKAAKIVAALETGS